MSPDPRPLLIAIMGPTASGKTEVAESLADRLGLQLINADAFMVYRGLDIGTNKPMRKAEYELIDIVDPDGDFGVGEWVQRASEVLWQIYNAPPLPEPRSAASKPGHPGFDPRRRSVRSHIGRADSPVTSLPAPTGEGVNIKSPFRRSPLPEPRSAASKPGHPESDPREGVGGGVNEKSPFHPTPDPAPQTLDPPPRGAIVVGGTGFYVRALFEEYTGLMHAPDPALRERLEDREQREGLPALAAELAEKAPEIAQATDLNNPVRVRRALEKLADPRPPIQFTLPPFAKAKFILDPPQNDLDDAIANRVDAMLDAGWEDEVRSLIANGLSKSSPALRAIGYQSLIGLIEGRLSKEEARLKTITETRHYAKRQRTWLRSEPSAHVVPTRNDATSATKSILECLKIPVN